MRRRAFIGTLGALVAAPVLARADQAMPVIGFLNTLTMDDSATYLIAFRRGLAEVGYVEGQNVAIEYRWAEGHYDRLRELAGDLVGRQVAVIATTGGARSALAAKRATPTIPIVFVTGGDPIELGLVASFNRPGGNVTGISLLTTELTTKRLEVLRDLVPGAKSIAFLVNPTSAVVDSGVVAKLLAAAQGIGLLVTILKASSPSEIDLAFASLAERPVDALLIGGDPLFNGRGDQLIAHAARQKIPVVFDTRSYAEAGGLASYGADYALAFREAGAYVGRILRGAKPTDLPVAQMSKVELVINAKTAKALGLTIPPAILTRADEVIE
jgi:putative tryptophan/tyrosine transport system substrate-binding protein